MKIKDLLELVYIKTKLASFYPFLLGALFSIYYFHSFHLTLTILFFLAMTIFDMATTTINNFTDYYKAYDPEYKQQTNIIGKAQLSRNSVCTIIMAMISITLISGIYLVYRTNILLLFIGGFCCFIGIFYSFGPIPFSRMPLGEILSGGTIGFGIFFITVFLNVSLKDFLQLTISNWHFSLTGNLRELLAVVWATIPTTFSIATIMLANNLCDLEEDTKNHRYTLPFYLGRKKSLQLFSWLLYACYISIFIGWILGIYHWSMLVSLPTFPIIQKNIKRFQSEQKKETTFILSVYNLIPLHTSQIFGFLLSILLTK